MPTPEEKLESLKRIRAEQRRMLEQQQETINFSRDSMIKKNDELDDVIFAHQKSTELVLRYANESKGILGFIKKNFLGLGRKQQQASSSVDDHQAKKTLIEANITAVSSDLTIKTEIHDGMVNLLNITNSSIRALLKNLAFPLLTAIKNNASVEKTAILAALANKHLLKRNIAIEQNQITETKRQYNTNANESHYTLQGASAAYFFSKVYRSQENQIQKKQKNVLALSKKTNHNRLALEYIATDEQNLNIGLQSVEDQIKETEKHLKKHPSSFFNSTSNSNSNTSTSSPERTQNAQMPTTQVNIQQLDSENPIVAQLITDINSYYSTKNEKKDGLLRLIKQFYDKQTSWYELLITKCNYFNESWSTWDVLLQGVERNNRAKLEKSLYDKYKGKDAVIREAVLHVIRESYLAHSAQQTSIKQLATWLQQLNNPQMAAELILVSQDVLDKLNDTNTAELDQNVYMEARASINSVNGQKLETIEGLWLFIHNKSSWYTVCQLIKSNPDCNSGLNSHLKRLIVRTQQAYAYSTPISNLFDQVYTLKQETLTLGEKETLAQLEWYLENTHVTAANDKDRTLYLTKKSYDPALKPSIKALIQAIRQYFAAVNNESSVVAASDIACNMRSTI